MARHYHLVLACPDRRGIVAAVTKCIADYQGFILDADQHSDPESGWFFMRYALDLAELKVPFQEFAAALETLSSGLSMRIVCFRATVDRQRLLLMVSLQAHCLEDVLYRWRCDELPAEIVGVVSNHEALRERTQWYGLPFYHLPVETGQKEAHFKAVADLWDELQPDVIGLARYMQILPDELCRVYADKIINIHHSFLPSFVGAKPYHQAYKKGVKLIGATSHYVTADLDEGPIIDQGVARINHRHTIEDCLRLGRDVERLVFANALRAHLEDRVIVHQGKTVVFE